MKYNSFQTPERRLLGAGPTNLYPEISKSLTKPEVGHLDPKFVEMMDEVKSMLRYLFQTKNEFTIAIIGLPKSPSCMPVARQRLRAPAMLRPCVDVLERYGIILNLWTD